MAGKPKPVKETRPTTNLRWGFPFGSKGLWEVHDVMQFLKASRMTVWRLAREGRIRKGNLNGRPKGAVRFCVRSVEAYAATLEA
jgi:hypothetical protein